MSRGPGRMMLAALAEIAAYGSAGAYGTASRAHHDQLCDCGDPICSMWDGHDPSRSELVSARRAIHALASAGRVAVHIQRSKYGGTRMLTAVSVATNRRTADTATLTCFHCGRWLGETNGGSGWSGPNGIHVCRECGHGTTNALALASREAS
jgi:hypothetical protein